MNKVFYALLTCSCFFSLPAMACMRMPSLFERIVEADQIGKISCSRSHEETKSYVNSSGKTISYVVVVYDFQVIQSFKGDLKSSRFEISKYRDSYFEQGELTAFFEVDKSGDLELSHHYPNTSNFFNDLPVFGLDEQSFATLCSGMSDVTTMWNPEGFRSTLNAVIDATSADRCFHLFRELTIHYRPSDTIDLAQTLVNSLSQERAEKLAHLFRESPFKHYLLADLAEKMQLSDFQEVLTQHLAEYYCEQSNSGYKNFMSGYVSHLDVKLVTNATTRKQKEMAAAFIKLRLPHRYRTYELPTILPIFHELYPQANLVAGLSELENNDLNWDARNQVSQNLVDRILSYQPVENEVRLRSNFCTNKSGEIPKLQFSVAPNPTTGPLLLSVNAVDPAEPIYLEVMSTSGEMLKGLIIKPVDESFIRELSMDELPPGTYYIKVYNRFSTDTQMLQVN